MIFLKKICHEGFVTRVLRNLSRRKVIPIVLKISDKEMFVNMHFENFKSNKIIFDISALEIAESDLSAKISFIFREQIFSFETRLMIENGQVYCFKPAEINVSTNRIDFRFQTRDEDNVVCQFLRQDATYNVVDLSVNGFSFLGKESLFQVGDFLYNIKINLDNGVSICTDGQVRYSKLEGNSQRYGINFIDMDWKNVFTIYKYIFNKKMPFLRNLIDFDDQEIYELFDKAGYFYIFDSETEDKINKLFKDMMNMQKLIKNREQINFSLAYVKDSKLYSTASVLRIYDKAFIGQHLASIPEARFLMGALSNIYAGTLDYLLSNPNFEYFILYIEEDLKWHKQITIELKEIISDESKFFGRKIKMFQCEIEKLDSISSGSNNGYYDIKMSKSQENFVNFANRTFLPIECECYSYDKERFFLEKIKEKYDLLEILIDRRLFEVYSKGEVVAFAVNEVFSNGLSFSNLLNMCKIYIIKKDIEDLNILISELLQNVAVFFEKYNKTEFFVEVQEDLHNINTINVRGLDFKFDFTKLIISRLGVLEWKNFLKLESRS